MSFIEHRFFCKEQHKNKIVQHDEGTKDVNLVVYNIVKIKFNQIITKNTYTQSEKVID
jgi:hypothetical protein